MTRPQQTPEEKRIAELENQLEQAKQRLRGQDHRINLLQQQNAFLTVYAQEVPSLDVV